MTRLLRRRYVIPAALVVALLATGGFVYARRSSDTVQYRTAAATLGTVTQTISLSGNLTPADTTALDFGGSGKVTAVNVQPGDQVTAGEVLATLDTTSEAATLQQSQATLASAQAKLSQDQAGATASQIASAQSQVSSAQVSLTNAVTSENDTKAVNDQSITQAQSAVTSAQNIVNADQQTVNNDCGSSPPPGSNCTADRQTLAKDEGTLSSAQSSLQATQVKAQQSDDQAAASVATAQVQLTNARSALAALSTAITPQQVQMDQAQVTIDQISVDNDQRAVDQSTLVAPGPGVVGEVNVTAGEQAGSSGGSSSGGGSSSSSSSSSSTHAIVLLTPGAFTVSGTVTDAQVGEIAVNQRANVLPAGSTEAVTGKVTSIAPEATVTSGVATFTVTVTLDGSQPALHAGASASISVVVNQVVQVLTVPTSAVRGSTVQVMVNGVPQTKAVQVGASDALRTQILGGINPGDLVVIATVTGTVPTTTTGNGAAGGLFGGGGAGGFRGAGGGGAGRGGGG